MYGPRYKTGRLDVLVFLCLKGVGKIFGTGLSVNVSNQRLWYMTCFVLKLIHLLNCGLLFAHLDSLLALVPAIVSYHL